MLEAEVDSREFQLSEKCSFLELGRSRYRSVLKVRSARAFRFSFLPFLSPRQTWVYEYEGQLWQQQHTMHGEGEGSVWKKGKKSVASLKILPASTMIMMKSNQIKFKCEA